MAKKDYLIFTIIALVLPFGITACAEVKQGRKNLRRIKYNKD